MEFKSPRYSSALASLVNGEPALETEDPLCKLNLKETSEFVKSFPRKRAVVDPAPSTPGRPVFRFSPSHHRKSFPSKWDDAEKWLVTSSSSSSHDSPAHHHRPASNNINNNNNIINNNIRQHQMMEAFSEKSLSSSINSAVRGAALINGVLASTDSLLLKDKYTDETRPATEATKEAFLFAAAPMKDAGTEMTPLGSSTATRCQTPILAASPARHNTPLDRSGPLGPSDLGNAKVVDVARLAKLQLYDSAAAANNWSSREEEEEEISKSLRHFEIYDKNFVTNNYNNNNNNASNNESRVARWDWEDEEKAKCCSRYQREEAKIQAWVNLQNAKAEAQSRKLEVKVQKMRSKLEEKLMKRMGVVHRKAEELRESARKQHSEEQMTQHSHNIFNCSNNNSTNINYHSHFSASCGCFPCNSSPHYV